MNRKPVRHLVLLEAELNQVDRQSQFVFNAF